MTTGRVEELPGYNADVPQGEIDQLPKDDIETYKQIWAMITPCDQPITEDLERVFTYGGDSRRQSTALIYDRDKGVVDTTLTLLGKDNLPRFDGAGEPISSVEDITLREIVAAGLTIARQQPEGKGLEVASRLLEWVGIKQMGEPIIARSDETWLSENTAIITGVMTTASLAVAKSDFTKNGTEQLEADDSICNFFLGRNQATLPPGVVFNEEQTGWVRDGLTTHMTMQVEAQRDGLLRSLADQVNKLATDGFLFYEPGIDRFVLREALSADPGANPYLTQDMVDRMHAQLEVWRRFSAQVRIRATTEGSIPTANAEEEELADSIVERNRRNSQFIKPQAMASGAEGDLPDGLELVKEAEALVGHILESGEEAEWDMLHFYQLAREVKEADASVALFADIEFSAEPTRTEAIALAFNFIVAELGQDTARDVFEPAIYKTLLAAAKNELARDEKLQFIEIAAQLCEIDPPLDMDRIRGAIG